MNRTPEESCITYNRTEIEQNANNIYEAINIIAKRSEQISIDLKEELTAKLDEFTFNSDSLEEIFENREQIEVSRHYEKLPKATSIAISEWLNNEIYFRRIERD